MALTTTDLNMEEDLSATTRLMAFHNILGHKRGTAKEAEYKETTDFAIALVHKLCGESSLELDPFKEVFTTYVKTHELSERGVTPTQLAEILLTYFPTTSSDTNETEDAALERGFTDTKKLRQFAIELHEGADPDVSGLVSWSQLEAYLVNTTLSGQHRTAEGAEDIFCPIDKGRTWEFFLNGHSMTHFPDIQRMVFCGNSRICTCSYTVTPGLSNPVDFEIITNLDINPEWLAVTCCVNIIEEEWLAVGFQDITLRIFDLSSYKIVSAGMHTTRLHYTATALNWHAQLRKLFLGDRSGQIHTFSLTTQMMGPGDLRFILKPLLRTAHHTNVVTTICFLPQDGGFCSASMDGVLVFFEPFELRVVSRFVGHTAGISVVAFCSAYNFLVTGGFDCCALAWLITTEPRAPFRLSDRIPHRACITAIECPEGSPTVITLDCLGCMKMWDMRYLRCTQSIDSRGGVSDQDSLRFISLCSFRTSPLQYYVVAATNRKVLYTFDSNNGKPVTNVTSAFVSPLIAGQNVESLRAFITVNRSHVSLWNDTNWTLRVSFSHTSYLTGDEDGIVSFATGALCRKYFVGYRHGNVTSHNITNGLHLGTYNYSATSALLFCGTKVNYLVAGSHEGCRILRENDESTQSICESPVTALHASRALSTIALGLESGQIVLHNTTLERLWQFPVAGRINPKVCTSDISALRIVDISAALLCAYTQGPIIVISLDGVSYDIMHTFFPGAKVGRSYLNYATCLECDEAESMSPPQSPRFNRLTGPRLGLTSDENFIFCGDDTGKCSRYRLKEQTDGRVIPVLDTFCAPHTMAVTFILKVRDKIITSSMDKTCFVHSTDLSTYFALGAAERVDQAMKRLTSSEHTELASLHDKQVQHLSTLQEDSSASIDRHLSVTDLARITSNQSLKQLDSSNASTKPSSEVDLWTFLKPQKVQSLRREAEEMGVLRTTLNKRPLSAMGPISWDNPRPLQLAPLPYLEVPEKPKSLTSASEKPYEIKALRISQESQSSGGVRLIEPGPDAIIDRVQREAEGFGGQHSNYDVRRAYIVSSAVLEVKMAKPTLSSGHYTVQRDATIIEPLKVKAQLPASLPTTGGQELFLMNLKERKKIKPSVLKHPEERDLTPNVRRGEYTRESSPLTETLSTKMPSFPQRQRTQPLCAAKSKLRSVSQKNIKYSI